MWWTVDVEKVEETGRILEGKKPRYVLYRILGMFGSRRDECASDLPGDQATIYPPDIESDKPTPTFNLFLTTSQTLSTRKSGGS